MHRNQFEKTNYTSTCPTYLKVSSSSTINPIDKNFLKYRRISRGTQQRGPTAVVMRGLPNTPTKLRQSVYDAPCNQLRSQSHVKAPLPRRIESGVSNMTSPRDTPVCMPKPFFDVGRDAARSPLRQLRAGVALADTTSLHARPSRSSAKLPCPELASLLNARSWNLVCGLGGGLIDPSPFPLCTPFPPEPSTRVKFESTKREEGIDEKTTNRKEKMRRTLPGQLSPANPMNHPPVHHRLKHQPSPKMSADSLKAYTPPSKKPPSLHQTSSLL